MYICVCVCVCVVCLFVCVYMLRVCVCVWLYNVQSSSIKGASPLNTLKKKRITNKTKALLLININKYIQTLTVALYTKKRPYVGPYGCVISNSLYSLCLSVDI